MVARDGIEAAAVVQEIPLQQIRKLAASGHLDDPTPRLFRTLITDIIMGDVRIDELPLDRRVDLIGSLPSFLQAQDKQLYQVEEMALSDIRVDATIDKWQSGFGPLDLVTGGLYQALMIIMAQPGVGKTSTMIVMAECLKRQYPECRILFFEQEIPKILMEARMAPIARRGSPFDKRDRLITGGTSITDIIRRGFDWVDRNQIIFVDSPDAMSFGMSENRRGDLEEVYRQLVRLKDRCKLVVTASQPRRADSILTQASVSESWAKAWYADMIVGISEIGISRRKMKILKNRFGPAQKEVIYEFDLENLSYSNEFDMLEEEWEDFS